MTDAQVIVVGGGPAGASVAHRLARSGHDVLVLDRARFPRDKPCSEYLSPQASRPLDEMGVLARIESAGAARLAGMRVHAPGGAVIHGEFDSPHHPWTPYRPHGLALPRRVLDAILLDAARDAGARVYEGARVSDVERDGHGRVRGVTVLDADGRARPLGASLVVGADGLRSVVARRLGLAHHARWPRRIAVVGHYEGVAAMGACGEMHVEGSGYTGLADVGRGITNVAVVVPASDARRIEGDPTSFLARWIAERPALAARFREARPTDAARATGPFASRARRAWAPGAALVGDAADFFDPFTGEGIYAALRGGEMLGYYAAEALAAREARGADVALAAYDRSRRHEFGGKWMVERLVALAVATPRLMDRAAGVLGARRDLADLLVGVTGDFVPARAVLGPGYWGPLVAGMLVQLGRRTPHRPAPSGNATTDSPPPAHRSTAPGIERAQAERAPIEAGPLTADH